MELDLEQRQDLDQRHADALKRLKAKRDFRNHLAAYVIVNAMLLAVWALSGGGYFWPGWILAGWGIGVAFNAYGVYLERPITEADIQREMDRSR
ncbi:MAG: 2TM domain-containing protein [Acidimicrobiia bacterium]